MRSVECSRLNKCKVVAEDFPARQAAGDGNPSGALMCCGPFTLCFLE
jgi:hypothetical protein